MPFTQEILLKVPTLLLGAVLIGLALMFAVAGLLLVRRLIPHHRLKLHHDVAGPIFGTVGVIYAVLLAFVFIVVWESFDKASLNAEKETNCLLDIYRDAVSFPPALKRDIRATVKEYARLVTTEEWDSLASGKASANVTVALEKLWRLYIDYSPKTESEKAFYTESVRKLNMLGELRSTRLIESRSGIHPLLLFVLLSGGAVTVTFTFFFGTESLRSQLVMTLLLTLLISLIIFTILLFDFPFTGSVSVPARAFQEVSLE